MTETGIPIENSSFMNAFQEEQSEEEKDIEISNETGFATADEKLYSLSRHEGWPVLKEFIESLVAGHKQSIGLKDGELPESYGARRLASDSAVSDLEKVINHIEQVAKYVREEDEKRKRGGGAE